MKLIYYDLVMLHVLYINNLLITTLIKREGGWGNEWIAAKTVFSESLKGKKHYKNEEKPPIFYPLSTLLSPLLRQWNLQLSKH